MLSDRRTFLRHAAALGLVGPVAAAAACADRPSGSPGSGGPASDPAADLRRVLRPVLVPGPADTVHIVAPSEELPAAYLSRGEMRLYLNRAHRDLAERSLAAYVSVTTGLWRIPRPEDDPRAPIIPDDALREFEVVDMGRWDPGMRPVQGDVRIRLGAPVALRMELSCIPLLTADAWISAEPVSIRRRDGPRGEGGREDFVGVGVGIRHADRRCGTAGEAVRILTWACPPEGR
jgi:hypothetical protein